MSNKNILVNLVEYAQKYIREHANAISILNENADVVEIIKNKYAPEVNIKTVSSNDERLNLIIKRFCIELQNYQAMPFAINYVSFGSGYENKIFKFVKENLEKSLSIVEIYQELHSICKFDEENSLSESLGKKIEADKFEFKNKKFNNAWLRYSIGIYDVMLFLNNDGLNRLQKEFEKERSADLDLNIFKNIYYMGTALTYDFYKELGRTDLIKPDVHIKNLIKDILNLKKLPSEKEVVKFFEENCLQREELYYIDKLLWLCCTGYFYEDNIKLLNMSRQNFIEGFKN